MPEPINKKLYNRIKARIKAERGRWSARKSERLVLEYKKAGGKYRGSKKNSKLRKWRRKEWKAPQLRVNTGALRKYAQQVSSASLGCTTDR